MSVKAIENYDHCLHFQVLDKRIKYIDDDAAEVVADNRGNICIHIDFDEQWDGCGKTARFIYEGQWVDSVLDAKNECICPSEVLKKGRFSLGVYGADLKVTTPIVVTVAASILSDCEGELPPAPTDDVYTQILKITADANIAADEATTACWAAVNSSDEAIRALNNATKELEEGGFVNSIKERNNHAKLSFWVGTQEQYDALTTKHNNCMYIVTDDANAEDVYQQLEALAEKTQKNEFDIQALDESVVKLEKWYIMDSGYYTKEVPDDLGWHSYPWKCERKSDGWTDCWCKFGVVITSSTKDKLFENIIFPLQFDMPPYATLGFTVLDGNVQNVIFTHIDGEMCSLKIIRGDTSAAEVEIYIHAYGMESYYNERP